MATSQPLIPSTATPIRTFEDHIGSIRALTTSSVGRQRLVVTGSADNTVGLWNLKKGVLLGKMKKHREWVRAVTVSRNGKCIASGDDNGELIIWDGKALTQTIDAHPGSWIYSLDFSPDGAILATGSEDKTMKFWSTETWQLQGNPIDCRAPVNCIQYSPSGTLVAVGTALGVRIFRTTNGRYITKMSHLLPVLAWTPNGTRLLSGGHYPDSTIRVWNSSTWQQVGDPWVGHTNDITAISVNHNGTLVASASEDKHVRLWRLSDQQNIIIFEHSHPVRSVIFSFDSKQLLSGGDDKKISEWTIPKDSVSSDPHGKQASSIAQIIANILPNTQGSVATDLDSASDANFTDRCKEMLEKQQWEQALLYAVKVIELNPSSYLGYQLEHAALHGAGSYDEAVESFQDMLSKLDSASDPHLRELRQQYLGKSEAEGVIRAAVNAQLDNTPIRVLDTTTGRLYDRQARIAIFKEDKEYGELLSSIMKYSDRRMERIEEVVGNYFRCVMLSHRWEEKEPLLHDIQENAVYKLSPVGGIAKLQSFCQIARDAGYRWAWSDTCCIDKNNSTELQQSLNAMFVWYRHSVLTIVYLSDVPPSSQPGGLARSEWNTRGWTVQEFLAPKLIRFYQKNWTLYLDDSSPNHKDSVAIRKELEDATGIHPQSLISFQPGMRNAREKLQWASRRVTTVQEDIAYSLFGIFGVQLHVIYGENKQRALGRLLQEIVAQSGDITALDWVGQSSEFNSCLPADISSYRAPPHIPPPLSEDEMQTSLSSLRNAAVLKWASKLYDQLDALSAPRFANCRLHLPCIAFRVTEVRLSQNQGTLHTYEVKADGLHRTSITTGEKMASSTRQILYLVRPWDRDLLQLPDPDDTQSEDIFWDAPEISQEYGDLELRNEQALQLIAHLQRPFSAFLLERQRGKEYKRVASDHDIIVKINDMAAVHDMVTTLEIL